MEKKILIHLLLLLTLSTTSCIHAQEIIQVYDALKKDSLRVGTGDDDFMAHIQQGYTLVLPIDKQIEGVLIFLEDSGYDQKNKNAKQLYERASKEGFAVLSVSSEIPFDFYFDQNAILTTHHLIQEVFLKHALQNKNVFFLGESLIGHRAMRYIKTIHEIDHAFQLNIQGIVICNFTLDWTRKWYQHKRDIRINRINLWEPTFINYMLETHLNGTPKTAPERYHEFSAYSFYDKSNRNIDMYKNYSVRAYIKPEIKHRLTSQYRTMYENNTTDIVGFLAELQLAGNGKTELIDLTTKAKVTSQEKAKGTWDSIDKDELMEWIMSQTEN